MRKHSHKALKYQADVYIQRKSLKFTLNTRLKKMDFVMTIAEDY